MKTLDHKEAIVVLIPVHNRLDETIRCLQSLAAQTWTNFRVIVIDDGSTDGTSRYLANHFSAVTLIQGDGNLWWSGAMNAGIRYCLRDSGFDFILLLNNDNTLDPASLENLLGTCHTCRKVVAGSIVYLNDLPDTVRFFGGTFDWWTGCITRSHYGERDAGQFDRVIETGWLGGMGVLVPVDLFREVGLFDEKRFPQYAGDQDLWLRAKRCGYTLLVDPRSKVWVSGTGDGEKKGLTFARLFDRRFHANLITTSRFYFRHGPRPWFPFCLMTFYLYQFVKWIKREAVMK